MIPVIFEEPDCMGTLGTGLRIHKVPAEGWDCVSGTENIRWCNETVPLGCAVLFNKLESRDLKMKESVLVCGVFFEPTYPEDLKLLSSGSTGDFLCAFVMNGNREDVDESAISIRMGVIAFGRCDHYIGSCAEIDHIRTSLEVVRRVIDAQCLVDRDLATLVDIGGQDIFAGRFVVLNQEP